MAGCRRRVGVVERSESRGKGSGGGHLDVRGVADEEEALATGRKVEALREGEKERKTMLRFLGKP